MPGLFFPDFLHAGVGRSFRLFRGDHVDDVCGDDFFLSSCGLFEAERGQVHECSPVSRGVCGNGFDGLFVEDVRGGFRDLQAEPDKFFCFIDGEFWQEEPARHPCADGREDIEVEHFFQDGLSGQNKRGGGGPGLGVVKE